MDIYIIAMFLYCLHNIIATSNTILLIFCFLSLMKIPKVNYMKNFNVNDQGFYGRFGGAYVPEILHANVEKLRECYLR